MRLENEIAILFNEILHHILPENEKEISSKFRKTLEL